MTSRRHPPEDRDPDYGPGPLFGDKPEKAPKNKASRKPNGSMWFDGETIGEGDSEGLSDNERLGGLLLAVREFMSDGEWHTLAEIQRACGGTEASCSARLRDLRKERFGKRTVLREPITRGLFKYRLLGRGESVPTEPDVELSAAQERSEP